MSPRSSLALLALVVVATASAAKTATYKAAVVEFATRRVPDATAGADAKLANSLCNIAGFDPLTAQAKAQGAIPVSVGFQGIIPVAVIDVGGANLYAVLLRVADKLGGGVKPHGLAVDQRRTKSGGVITFEPCRHINEQGKAGGMAFGKTIFAEAFNLAETPLGEILRIAARHHAFDKPHAKFMNNAAFAKRRHGAA